MKNIVLVAFFLILCLTNAQNQRDAVKMNDGILPVSLYVGYSNDHWSAGRLTPGYEYNREEEYSYLVGLDYIFAKTGKFQFTVGAYYKKSLTKGELIVPGSNIETMSDFNFNFEKDYGLLQIPLRVHFVQKLSPKIFASINGGISYAKLYQSNSLINNELLVDGERVLGFTSFDSNDVIRIQYELGFTTNYKSPNSGLFGLGFIYHFESDSTVVTGDTIFSENIPNEQEYISNFKWKGGFTAINFHWSPPKSWFQKKQ